MAYVKGMLLFDNLREVVGDKKFFNALKHYYSNNMFKLVTPDTLIDDFSVSCKTNLKSFFDSWISGNVVIKAVE
jgi:aminopeptidase N